MAFLVLPWVCFSAPPSWVPCPHPGRKPGTHRLRSTCPGGGGPQGGGVAGLGTPQGCPLHPVCPRAGWVSGLLSLPRLSSHPLVALGPGPPRQASDSRISGSEALGCCTWGRGTASRCTRPSQLGPRVGERSLGVEVAHPAQQCLQPALLRLHLQHVTGQAGGQPLWDSYEELVTPWATASVLSQEGPGLGSHAQQPLLFPKLQMPRQLEASSCCCR